MPLFRRLPLLPSLFLPSPSRGRLVYMVAVSIYRTVPTEARAIYAFSGCITDTNFMIQSCDKHILGNGP